MLRFSYEGRDGRAMAGPWPRLQSGTDKTFSFSHLYMTEYSEYSVSPKYASSAGINMALPYVLSQLSLPSRHARRACRPARDGPGGSWTRDGDVGPSIDRIDPSLGLAWPALALPHRGRRRGRSTPEQGGAGAGRGSVLVISFVFLSFLSF